MSDRADVLGALLEFRSNPYEQMVGSQKAVSGQVAAQRKKLAAGKTPGDFNSKHPRGGKGSGRGGKFIAKGSSGAAVNEVQKRLGKKQTGQFAFDTVAAVQNFQREHGLKVDGVVGAQTAQALLGNRNAKAVKPGELSAADRKALGVSEGKSSRSRKGSAPSRPAPPPKPERERAPSRRTKVRKRAVGGRSGPEAPTRAAGGQVL